eukprot:4412790-Karenia_brevis.AAC.1
MDGTVGNNMTNKHGMRQLGRLQEIIKMEMQRLHPQIHHNHFYPCQYHHQSQHHNQSTIKEGQSRSNTISS